MEIDSPNQRKTERIKRKLIDAVKDIIKMVGLMNEEAMDQKKTENNAPNLKLLLNGSSRKKKKNNRSFW